MGPEAKIQSRIITELKKRGYIPMKLVKSNLNGIPDLQVLLGNGKHLWIEVKQPNGKLSEIQKYRIRELEELGDTAWVIYSYEEFIEKIGLLN